MIIKDFDLDDVFLMSEIIEKMDISIDTDAVLSKIKGSKNADKAGKDFFVTIGIDFVTKIAKRLHKAKVEVKQLIANLTGKSAAEVSKMSLKEIKLFFQELVQHEGFTDFLKQAGE